MEIYSTRYCFKNGCFVTRTMLAKLLKFCKMNCSFKQARNRHKLLLLYQVIVGLYLAVYRLRLNRLVSQYSEDFQLKNNIQKVKIYS